MAEEYLTGESPRSEPPKVWLWVKNLFIFFALLAIVVGSFWASFQLGKRILLPVRKPRIDVPIPEPPPSLSTLEKSQPLITKEVVEEVERIYPLPQREVKGGTGERSAYGGKSYYKVQVGWSEDENRVLSLAQELKSKGFDVFVRKIGNGWRVQVGAFKSRVKAEDLQKKLKREGFNTVIVFE